MTKYLAWTLSFIAGFLLMVLELTASRIMAPLMGTSLYTWTAVIGVVLMGLSFGAYAGGRVIDRWPHLRTLGYVFFVAGISIALLFLLSSAAFLLVTAPLPIPVLATGIAMLLFFLPSFVLGMIQPMIVRLSTSTLTTIGKSYGSLSAVWSLGSILGVFATGFILIPEVGSMKTLVFLSMLLVFIGGGILRKTHKGKMLGTMTTLLFLLSLSTVAVPHYAPNVLFAKETAYYSAFVADTTLLPRYGTSRLLFLDLDTHSIARTNIDEPMYTDVARLLFAGLTPTSKTLTIGAGAYTFPNELARLSSSSVEVLEVDPEVPHIAQQFFPIDPKIQTSVNDARIFLTHSDQHYDLIVGDAFSSYISVPWHLLTKEFDVSVSQHLNQNGVYAINIISGVKGEKSALYAAVYSTLKQVFPYVEVYAFGGGEPEAQNIVLIASRSSLNDLVAKGKIINIVAGKSGVFENIRLRNTPQQGMILTDDYAPTEKLLSPITEAILSRSILLHQSVLPTL